VIDRRASPPEGNGIGTLRVLLALMVVVSHSFELGGFGPDPWAQATGTDTLGVIAVCSFFLLSGWLVGRSAERSDPLTFFTKRVRRLLPAFWASLLLVAVMATVVRPDLGPDAMGYVAANAALRIQAFDIGDLTAGLPYAGSINGSLWTLQYEALCYLLILGVVRFRVALLVLVGVMWGLAMGSGLLELKFIAMFGLGAALRNSPPHPSHLAAILAATVVLISGQLGLYDYLGLPALAVVVYWAAHNAPRRSRDDDPSYGIYVFAFPIQQGLAAAGLIAFGWAPYVVTSLVFAFLAGKASWTLIERPFLGAKRRQPTPSVQIAPAASST
jgi:peptidoglycan/LPS O-acetylase OafA/YrhL